MHCNQLGVSVSRVVELIVSKRKCKKLTLLKYEEQLTELVDRQEEQLSEVVDRRDKHLTVMTNRRKKRLVGMADRQGQKEPKPADTPPMTPHFFKIILSPHASKLHIPNEFVKEHGTTLGDFVFLEVPNGVVWKVKLLNCSGMVWLNEGWNKFKEYYSIACGYFLLFRCKGNSQFSVFIFDLSASEIEYPPGPSEDTTQNQCVVDEPPEENGINVPPPSEQPEENRINVPPPSESPEENGINVPPLNEPPEENGINIAPPSDQPEDNGINVPPPSEPPEENGMNVPPPSEPAEENGINVGPHSDQPEENGINVPTPSGPPEENGINIPPPSEPPEENTIILPPPGIYTMEELSLTSMPSRPWV